MTAWWGSLGIAEQLFYGVAIVATVVVFIQMVLMLIGSDVGGEVEFELDTEHASGLKALSLQTISTFLVGLGWIGGGVLSMTGSVLFALLIGGLVGFGGSSVIFFMMKWAHNVREKGNVDPRNAIGQTAKVYIPIPPNREGEGQIEIKFQNRFRVVQAVTSSGETLPAQTEVLVVDLADNNVMVVRPLHQPQLSNNQPQPQLPNT